MFFGASAESVTWSLASVVVDGTDVTDLPITIGPDAPPKSIVVTYGDRWQELSGRLTLSSGAPATDYTMIVFPANKAYWIPGRAGSARRTRARTDSSRFLDRAAHASAGRLPAGGGHGSRTERRIRSRVPRLAHPAAVPITLLPGQRKVQDLVVK